MQVDILAEALEALKLKGTVYFEADFRAPWGMAIPANQVAAFHIVAAGACWLRLSGREPVEMSAGDIALLPHGNAHELKHAREAETLPAEEVLEKMATEPLGGSGTKTSLICGHFAYEHKALHPFFESLPDVVHVGADGERASWLATASRLAAAESAAGQRGASAVVDRLAEALLMQTLRVFFDRSPESSGFIAAMRDPNLGRALSALHGDVARDWSLDDLARRAGLSRSSFADRFRQLVGESPMKYLARWRMLEARELLRDPALSIAAVASRVGYHSEFAFSRTFKRFHGDSPGTARRSA